MSEGPWKQLEIDQLKTAFSDVIDRMVNDMDQLKSDIPGIRRVLENLVVSDERNFRTINQHEKTLDSLLHDFEVNEQSLVRAHTNIAQLKVGIPASAHGLNDLAIQAETDLVRSNLCNEPSLASDVLSLCVSQLITKEEARRLMGFKS